MTYNVFSGTLNPTHFTSCFQSKCTDPCRILLTSQFFILTTGQAMSVKCLQISGIIFLWAEYFNRRLLIFKLKIVLIVISLVQT